MYKCMTSVNSRIRFLSFFKEYNLLYRIKHVVKMLHSQDKESFLALVLFLHLFRVSSKICQNLTIS